MYCFVYYIKKTPITVREYNKGLVAPGFCPRWAGTPGSLQCHTHPALWTNWAHPSSTRKLSSNNSRIF